MCLELLKSSSQAGNFVAVVLLFKVVPTPWRCFFLILVLLVSIFQHTTSLD